MFFASFCDSRDTPLKPVVARDMEIEERCPKLFFHLLDGEHLAYAGMGTL
jgi:hypothetical protein